MEDGAPAVPERDEPVAASAALDTARRRRSGVRAAAAEVEHAAAAPGQPSAWAKHLRVAVDGLREAWSLHVQATEAADGLFVEIVSQAPRLSHRCAQLRRDHAAIDEAIAAAAGRLGAVSLDEASVVDIRDTVIALLGRIVRHRHLGADLVYEAYNVDIEGGE
jgi:hypothetical protein